MVDVIGRVVYGDPIAPELARKLRISINGDRVRYVIAFDTVAGWADIGLRDWLGKCLMGNDRKPVIERRYGRVRCIVRDATAAELGGLIRQGLALA
jgi:hypothetical protein